MIEDGTREKMRQERYRDWEGEAGRRLLTREATLDELADRVEAGGIEPEPRSGRQERLENLVGRFV